MTLGNNQKSSLRDILVSVRQRLQAISAGANTITDLTIRVELRDQVADLERALDAAISLHEVPLELCHALRTPADTAQLVELHINGQAARVAVRPLGRIDPEREVAVWHDLAATVGACSMPGKELRSMEPEVVAVQIGAAVLVVNTAHSRAAVRAALGMLRHGAFLSAPLLWLWDRARRRPKQTAVVAAVLVVATASGLALASMTQPVPSEDTPATLTVPAIADPGTPMPDQPLPPAPSQLSSTTPPVERPMSSEEAPLPPPGPKPPPAADTAEDKRPDTSSPKKPEDDADDSPRDDPDSKPSPAARSTAFGNTLDESSSPPTTTGRSPRPDPTKPPEAAPSSSSPSDPPTPPAPAASTPPPAAAPNCHLIEIDLPILGVCL